MALEGSVLLDALGFAVGTSTQLMSESLSLSHMSSSESTVARAECGMSLVEGPASLGQLEGEVAMGLVILSIG